MTELFRYIEQSFVTPSAIPAINVGSESNIQESLRGEISKRLPPDQIRGTASNFILKNFSSPGPDPFHLGAQYLSFGSELLTLHSPGTHAVEDLVSNLFGRSSSTLVSSNPFLSDKALLDDTLVCVKIATAFDRVNTHSLVAMRQAIAFIEDFVADKVTADTTKGIGKTLRRPIRIPREFVKSLTLNTDRQQSPPEPDPSIEGAARKRTALMVEQQHLKTTYDTIMSLPPDQFEFRPVSVIADQKPIRNDVGCGAGNEVLGGAGFGSTADAVSAPPSFLAIPKAVVERLGGDVHKTLEKANIDITGAPVSHVITAIKKQWQDVSQQLAPYQIPVPAKVFRVGVHLFAFQDDASATVSGTKEAL